MFIDSRNLLDDFEYSGFWWLPTTPENKVPGPGPKLMIHEIVNALTSEKEAVKSDLAAHRTEQL
jgi:hypothetical protein